MDTDRRGVGHLLYKGRDISTGYYPHRMRAYRIRSKYANKARNRQLLISVPLSSMRFRSSFLCSITGATNGLDQLANGLPTMTSTTSHQLNNFTK